ncbi:testicular acid phosphatase homolog [Symsagittifera roscoffensis]|uniref:testicular acid phosphatase homolog n=1 Tax=Symsagittifera roscoffensis TaxID=84072 RepID=UPI00307BDDCF
MNEFASVVLFVSLAQFFEEVTSELVYLQAVCRHGDRAPIEFHPNYQHIEKWNMGRGRLTEKGMDQCYLNGRMYRNHYQKLFSEPYNPNEMIIQSSHIDRTITSGQSFAAGFLGSGYLPEVSNTGKYVPYPVHSISDEVDYYLAGAGRICAQLISIFEDYTASQHYSLFVAENQEKIGHVCEKAGYPLKEWSLTSVCRLADTFTCDKAHGLSLPDWLDEDTWQTILNISQKARELRLTYPGVKTYQVGGGGFIHLLLENLRGFVNGTQNETVFNLYYAHDNTLLGFLTNLNYDDLRSNPVYTSCINIELHYTNDRFLVDVLYKNESESMTMHRLVPWGCPQNESCLLENFFISMEGLENPDPAAACRPTDIVIQLTFTASHLVVLSVSSCILLITLLTLAYACGLNRATNKLAPKKRGVHYAPLKFMSDL